MLSRYTLLILNGAILTVCAVFIEPDRNFLITALLLGLPLLDAHYRKVSVGHTHQEVIRWIITSCLILSILTFNPEKLTYLLTLILFVALPEEWFFRRYIQQSVNDYFSQLNTDLKISTSWLAILLTSGFFSLVHIPLQGYSGLLVFFPSLILGYVYQMKKDLVFVILLHSLFNLFFIAYLQDIIKHI